MNWASRRGGRNSNIRVIGILKGGNGLIEIGDDFQDFATPFIETAVMDAPAPIAKAGELMASYRTEPTFWLRYANWCLAQDDFQEASLALDWLARLLEEQRGAHPDAPGLGPVMAAFLSLELKIRTDMLNRVAFGIPSMHEKRIPLLQRRVGLNQAEIMKGLGASLALIKQHSSQGNPVDAKWTRQLEQLYSVYSVEDFGLRLDLSNTLMMAGRFQEAVRLLNEPFTADHPGNQESADRQGRWYLQLLDWLGEFRRAPLSRVTPFRSAGERYVLPIIVWGDAYLDSLEQFTLPTLLAQGNLPYLQGAGEAHLLIFTTEAGAERLATMPVLRKVKQYAAVDLITFPAELTVRPDIYKLMSSLHLASMAVSQASHSHFVFLAPDVVFCDTFLQALDQRRQQGAEVVFVSGLILHSEPFEAELHQRFPIVEQVLALSSSDLLALGMRHLHPFVKHAYVYSPNGHRSTVAVLMWPLEAGGYVVHGYHHTPFLITAQAMARFDGSMFTTLDGDFLPKILRTREEVERCAMITDPLEANYFELSRGDRFGAVKGTDLGRYDMGAFDLGRLARWGTLLGEVAQWLLPQKICYIPDGRGTADPAHAASAQVVADLLRRVDHLKTTAGHLPIR